MKYDRAIALGKEKYIKFQDKDGYVYFNESDMPRKIRNLYKNGVTAEFGLKEEANLNSEIVKKDSEETYITNIVKKVINKSLSKEHNMEDLDKELTDLIYPEQEISKEIIETTEDLDKELTELLNLTDIEEDFIMDEELTLDEELSELLKLEQEENEFPLEDELLELLNKDSDLEYKEENYDFDKQQEEFDKLLNEVELEYKEEKNIKKEPYINIENNIKSNNIHSYEAPSQSFSLPIIEIITYITIIGIIISMSIGQLNQ